MPTNIVDVSTFTDPIVAPAAGDPRTAASVVTSVQGLSNRSRYLKDRSLEASSVTNQNLPIHGQSQTAGHWTYWEGKWRQDDVGGARELFIDLDLPPGVTVTQIRLHLLGGGGTGHVGLPATKPQVIFQELLTATTHIATTIASASDSSGDVAAYNLIHAITLGSLSHVVSKTKRYQLKVLGETGANSQTQETEITGVDINWTAPA